MVLDNIDFDKAARFTGEALGVPSEIIRPEQDVTELRQARAEAQQKAQANAMAKKEINEFDYKRLFEETAGGQEVLEELIRPHSMSITLHLKHTTAQGNAAL